MCLFNVSRCQYHGPSNCPEVASMFGEKGVIGLAKKGLLNIDTASTRALNWFNMLKISNICWADGVF